MRSPSSWSTVLGVVLGWVVAGAPPAGAATEAELQSAVFRAKPAVVMIGVQVGSIATVHCATGAPEAARGACAA